MCYSLVIWEFYGFKKTQIACFLVYYSKNWEVLAYSKRNM